MFTAENNLTVKGNVALGDALTDSISMKGIKLLDGSTEHRNGRFYVGQKNDEAWFEVNDSATSPYVEIYGMPLVVNGAGGISIDTGDLSVGGTSYLSDVEIDY